MNKKIYLNVFKKLNKENYVVYKYPKYEDVSRGSDIDIISNNIEKFAKIIYNYFSEFIVNDEYVEIIKTENNIKIDICDKKGIVFRFDLLSQLPVYTKLNIKKSLLIEIFTKKTTFNITEDIKIFVPCILHELLLRYFEFHEYYNVRSDKIKHLDIIKLELEKNDLTNEFNDLIFYFTKTRINDSIKKKKSSSYVYNKIKQYGLIKSIKIGFKKLFNKNKGVKK